MSSDFASAFPAQGRPETVSAADATYQLLRAMILEGKLASGTRLREVEVAERLGVSRTPLREALARLAGDRLIRRRGGGVEVTDMYAELVGIRHIRMALEGYATRLAAARISESDIEALEESVQLSASLPYEAPRERVAVNTEFHQRICRACDVPQLIDAIDKYSEYFMDEDDLKQLSADESRVAINEHMEIVNALKERDADKAEALMRSHLMYTFNKIIAKANERK